MKTTYVDILLAQQVLVALGKTTLPAKLKLRVARLLRELNGHQQDFVAARGDLVAEHALRDKDGAVVMRTVPLPQGGETDDVALKDCTAFERAVRELGMEEVDVETAPLTLEDLKDPTKPAEVLGTGEQLAALGPFLDLGEP